MIYFYDSQETRFTSVTFRCSERHLVVIDAEGVALALLFFVVDDREEVTLAALRLLGLEPQPRQRLAYFVGVERRSTKTSVVEFLQEVARGDDLCVGVFFGLPYEGQQGLFAVVHLHESLVVFLDAHAFLACRLRLIAVAEQIDGLSVGTVVVDGVVIDGSLTPWVVSYNVCRPSGVSGTLSK